MNQQETPPGRPDRRRRRRCVVALLIVLAVGTLSAFVLYERYLPNLRVLRPGVFYRSGQPRGVGLPVLGLMGVKTVVTLRSKMDDEAVAEAAWCQRHGVRFVRVPLKGDHEAIDQSVAEIMALVADPQNHPILIHCARGKERSGLVSAVFRMDQDGWCNPKALREMYDRGLVPGSWPVFEEYVWHYVPRAVNGEAHASAEILSAAGAKP